ncbi:MICOS complex subunit MIC10-like isoform X2 [Rhodnius prolixus]|uniref:MICOS complex subunit MIC10 n=2 Tax=Rhodnius prolixus TaxID=13249 RepID=T1HM66_RHOPR
MKETWKNCLSDGTIIIGGGIFVGAMVSILTHQSWPIMFGLGIGMGTAFDNCESPQNKDDSDEDFDEITSP